MQDADSRAHRVKRAILTDETIHESVLLARRLRRRSRSARRRRRRRLRRHVDRSGASNRLGRQIVAANERLCVRGGGWSRQPARFFLGRSQFRSGAVRVSRVELGSRRGLLLRCRTIPCPRRRRRRRSLRMIVSASLQSRRRWQSRVDPILRRRRYRRRTQHRVCVYGRRRSRRATCERRATVRDRGTRALCLGQRADVDGTTGTDASRSGTKGPECDVLGRRGEKSRGGKAGRVERGGERVEGSHGERGNGSSRESLQVYHLVSTYAYIETCPSNRPRVRERKWDEPRFRRE